MTQTELKAQHAHDEEMAPQRKEFAAYWKEARRQHERQGISQKDLAMKELANWRVWRNAQNN